jgi:uncharacterized protein (TIGR03435 family)
VRFAVWFTASVKFLIPFSLLIELGRRLAPRQILAPKQSRDIADIVQGGGVADAAAPFRVLGEPQTQTQVEWSQVILAGLVTIWAVGATVVLLRWAREWWRVRRAAMDAKPTGNFAGVPVFESRQMREAKIEPGVFGLLRPRILVPEGIEGHLGAEPMRAVLMHECNHIRRYDNLTAAIQMVVEAIFWFHPLVWMIGRKLMEERELACDQAVLAETQPDVYAEGILNVCKFYCTSRLDCVPGISGADLRGRLESILKNQPSVELGWLRRWALGASLVVIAFGPSLFGVLMAQQAETPQGNSFVGLATEAVKKFEVSTVKPSDPNATGFRLGPPGRGEITIVNVALRGVIVQAFRTQRDMVFGGPAWIETTKYDIVGKGPDPNVGNPEVWEMMRSLLIERFHLRYHVEEREMPVMALVVGPKGHKLTPGAEGRCKEEIKAGKNCGDILIPPFGTAIYNMPIGSLFSALSRGAGRPVIDRTGLTGRYDVNLTWLREGQQLKDLDLSQVPKEYQPADMDMFEALEKQAGLKLEPAKAKMPVIVIDFISKPDDN